MAVNVEDYSEFVAKNGSYTPMCFKDDIYLQNTLNQILRKFLKMDEINEKIPNYKKTFAEYMCNQYMRVSLDLCPRNVYPGVVRDLFGTHTLENTSTVKNIMQGVLYSVNPHDKVLRKLFSEILDYDGERYINGYDLEVKVEKTNDEVFIRYDRAASMNILFQM